MTSTIYTLPFIAIGSGISVHGFLMSTRNNFTVSLDGNMVPAPSPTSYVPDWVDDSDTSVIISTLYDIQSLPLAYHVLNMSLLNYSFVAFDYAYITTDPSTYSSSLTPTATGPSMSSVNNPIHSR